MDAAGVYMHTAHGHVARTTTRARYADVETARQSLVRRAREHTQLGRLLVPETVLVAQSASDGGCWLWSVKPEIPTLASELGNKRRSHRETTAAYGRAVVDALRASLRHGFSVELSPRDFGLQLEVVRYIGDISSEAPSAESLSASVFGAVDALVHADADVSAFLEAFEDELKNRLTPDERARTFGSSSMPESSGGNGRLAAERLQAVLARAADAS